MKPQAALLIVLGLLLGPGYLAYCHYLSGSAPETFALSDRRERWELPDGAILRFRSGLGYKPQPVELDPRENRYRFSLRLEVAAAGPATGKSGNEYQFSVLLDDAALMQRTFHVAGSGTLWQSFDPIEVPYPGRYVVLLEEIGKPTLTVTKASLEVRSGAEQPQMWLAWSGVVLLVAGVIVQFREALASGRVSR